MTETNPPEVPAAERRQLIDLIRSRRHELDESWQIADAILEAGYRLAVAVPDTGQAREPDAEHPVTRMERGIRTALFGTDAEVAAARAEPSGDTVQAPAMYRPCPCSHQPNRAACVASGCTCHDTTRATDTTPDRLAWISKAGETAAAERQARYQETACARRPAEERPDA